MRPPSKISYGWTQRNPGDSPPPPSPASPSPESRPSNRFANTLSILAIIMSTASGWYTVQSERGIATESIRSQSRAILYIGNDFGFFTNDDRSSLDIKFELHNSGQTSAKNVTVRVATMSGNNPDDKGRPPKEWPTPEVHKIRQIEKVLPFNVPVYSQSPETISDIIAGRKALWVDIGVVYEDEWGQRYDTTKCFAITRVQDAITAQLCAAE